jgi:transcriptional regulator with XRE-family HTH domain
MNERAERIKMLIEKSGKSYRELEDMTGITRSTLQRYAAGVTSKIPMDVVQKLEEALGAPRGYIMGWNQKPAEELQGIGALAARVLMDPDAAQMVQQYMALEESDRQAIRDFMALSQVDRYAVQLVMASMAGKQKKADAEASAVSAEVRK